jgi:precorrin-2 dehydrogenase/sirohydrochlorin ferrochelatase
LTERGWYPVNIRIDDKSCVVVGGGTVAYQKVSGLLGIAGKVTVISPRICDQLAELYSSGEIEWIAKDYEEGEIEGFYLAITATDDPSVNRQVYLDGERLGIPVNSADDPENCRFILPSRVIRGSLVISISTGGRSPAMAAHLRRRLEEEFGPEWGVLTELLGEARDAIRSSGRSSEGMNEKWEAAISDEVLKLIRDGSLDEARKVIDECLS